MVELIIGLLILICVALVAIAILFFRSIVSAAKDGDGRAPTVGDLNKLKGQAGEAEVTRILLRLPPEDYELFTTVILPKDAERSRVEMDHVVLSRFGIFVVETKRWGGEVHGGVDGEWSQQIGRQFHWHRNPYAQNERQVRRLRQHLDVAPSAIRGIVCFVGDTMLGGDVPDNVVRAGGLLDYIGRFRSEQLNPEGLAAYRARLTELTRSDR